PAVASATIESAKLAREETEETAEPTNKQQNVEVGQSPFDDQLLSSESAEHCGFRAPSDSIVQDDKTRNVVLIEGNKAIVWFWPHPWPKRPARIPMTEQYKLPNPRLSAALSCDARTRRPRRSRERQEIVDELSRGETASALFLKGVYCLPKSLLLRPGFSQRLYVGGYSLPTDKLPRGLPGCPATVTGLRQQLAFTANKAAFEFDVIASNASLCCQFGHRERSQLTSQCARPVRQRRLRAASDAASVYRKQLDGVPGYQQQIGGTFWVFQQRQTGQIAFNRSWDDYVAGFGTPPSFGYTLAQVSSLRIEIFTAFGEFYVFEWLNFTIGDSGTNYRMNYNSFVSANSTTNCDFLSRARGQQFSTFDKDNDGASYSCCH
uniref:Fibrinogen C-terminal domain-containing protein n=1 Tax=Macrostomum lignano TaxID=282301 RepID=A0A1I8JQ79_9PLAT